MTTQFKVLFNLELNHDYFPNRKLQGASIFPSTETQKIIKKMGGVLRQTEAGYSVFYNTSNAHSLTEELLTDWEFHLQYSDPSFYIFTDLPTDSNSFLFTDSAQDKILKLTEENDEQESEVEVEAEPKSEPQPSFNGIKIKFSPSIPAENHEAEVFTLHFSARKTIWRYFIINNSGLSGTISIKSEGVTFTDLGTKEIQGGTQAQVFQSDSPITLSQIPSEKFDLLMDKENIIELPNASTNQILAKKDKKNTFYSDLYIYI